jgi:FkbM family methyltransferase
MTANETLFGDDFLPTLSEPYFEWIAVLEAVVAAGPRFVMVELGSGYGSWMVRAAAALRQVRPATDIALVGVEPDARHYRWMRQHLTDNGFSPRRHHLIQGAVAERPGSVFFHAGDSRRWYGQAIVDPGYVANLKAMPEWQARNNAYVGAPSWLDRLVRPRRRFISEVPAFDLTTILARVAGPVDLIHMDIQGAEARVVAPSLDLLDARVRALHIGTHSKDIEDTLRSLLHARGWHLRQEYAGLSHQQTPYGPVEFVDGVQSWTNPALPPPSSQSPPFGIV